MSMKKLQVMKKQAEKPDMMQHARGLIAAKQAASVAQQKGKLKAVFLQGVAIAKRKIAAREVLSTARNMSGPPGTQQLVNMLNLNHAKICAAAAWTASVPHFLARKGRISHAVLALRSSCPCGIHDAFARGALQANFVLHEMHIKPCNLRDPEDIFTMHKSSARPRRRPSAGCRSEGEGTAVKSKKEGPARRS
ncbi:unnamed protein product [Amoebophrya sp. A120]|nr:unnamed protein product [Amoebophrya sp. A120]|eukprot:GSA120T00007045001.1